MTGVRVGVITTGDVGFITTGEVTMVVVSMAVTTGVDGEDDEDGVEFGTGVTAVNTGDDEFVVVALLLDGNSVDTGELLMAMTGRLGLLPTDTARVTGDRKLLFELLLTIL